MTTVGAIGVSAPASWVWCAEQPASQCNVVGPVAIGEEAVVTDAVKSVGQDVDQKAADELVGVERHQLVAGLGLGPVILPFERHALAIKGDEPAVGNSNPVGVAGQVGQDSVGSAKRRFSILPIIPELESRFVTPTTRCIGRQPQSCA